MKKEFNELLEKTIKNLVNERKNSKLELYNLRIKNNMRALKQTHKIKIEKKKIAMINTALSIKLKNKDDNNKQ